MKKKASKPARKPDISTLKSEGDLNLSPHRQQWLDNHIDEETLEWLNQDTNYFLRQSLSTPCLNALKGYDGIYVEDLQGRRYMDFHGNNVHQVGFRNPRVIAAIKTQLDQLPFCPRRYTNFPAIRLAKKLAELAPGNLKKVLFAPGGTTAIGMALKLARAATGRFKTISMWDSFHGASLDAISVGGEAIFRRDIGPLLPEISWLRGVRNRKLLICRTRNKKVSTTFLISSLVRLRGLAPEIGGCAAVVEAANPSPASPKPDDVLLRVVCSGASPIRARRRAA